MHRDAVAIMKPEDGMIGSTILNFLPPQNFANLLEFDRQLPA
jgi:hypothetical protein